MRRTKCEMNDVIVVTSCTEKKCLANEYERQLTTAGIDHVFEYAGFATSAFSMTDRIRYWRELAIRFHDYKMIVLTDAWDVLFFGSKQDLLDKLQTLLISAERNFYPGAEHGEKDKIKGREPWRYANVGMVAANPECLLEWLRKAERTPNCWLDQAWLNRRLGDGLVTIPLDEATSLFYTISFTDGRLEDGSLQIKEGKLWNSQYGTYPNFVHFAGHGDEAVRVLPGQDEPRYETMNLIRKLIEAETVMK